VWCGHSALEGAVTLVVIPSLLFGLVQRKRGGGLDAASGCWWFLYLGGLLLLAELSGTGGLIPGGEPGQLLLVAAFALAIFPVAVRSRLPRPSSAAEVAVDVRP
jgi:hypothetical protein